MLGFPSAFDSSPPRLDNNYCKMKETNRLAVAFLCYACLSVFSLFVKVTCVSDPVVLGSFPVAPPRCLQSDSLKTTRYCKFIHYIIIKTKQKRCSKNKCLQWKNIPMVCFLASSASSVTNRVLGKRIKILDLNRKQTKINITPASPLLPQS